MQASKQARTHTHDSTLCLLIFYVFYRWDLQSTSYPPSHTPLFSRCKLCLQGGCNGTGPVRAWLSRQLREALMKEWRQVEVTSVELNLGKCMTVFSSLTTPLRARALITERHTMHVTAPQISDPLLQTFGAIAPNDLSRLLNIHWCSYTYICTICRYRDKALYKDHRVAKIELVTYSLLFLMKAFEVEQDVNKFLSRRINCMHRNEMITRDGAKKENRSININERQQRKCSSILNGSINTSAVGTSLWPNCLHDFIILNCLLSNQSQCKHF